MKKNIDIQNTFQNIKELPLEVSFDEVATMVNQQLPPPDNTPSHISDYLTIKNFLIMSGFISIIAFFVAFSSSAPYENTTPTLSDASIVTAQTTQEESASQIATIAIKKTENTENIEVPTLALVEEQKANNTTLVLATDAVNQPIIPTSALKIKPMEKSQKEKTLITKPTKKNTPKQIVKSSTSLKQPIKIAPSEPFITFLVKDFDNKSPLSEVCVKLKKNGALCGVTDEKGFFFLKDSDFEKCFPMMVVFEKKGYASGEIEITASGLSTIELVSTSEKAKKDKRSCAKQAIFDFEAALLKDKLIKDAKNYEYKITNKIFKVNGRKLSEATRKKYQNIYESTCNKKLGKFTIKYKTTPSGTQHHISSHGRNL